MNELDEFGAHWRIIAEFIATKQCENYNLTPAAAGNEIIWAFLHRQNQYWFTDYFIIRQCVHGSAVKLGAQTVDRISHTIWIWHSHFRWFNLWLKRVPQANAIKRKSPINNTTLVCLSLKMCKMSRRDIRSLSAMFLPHPILERNREREKIWKMGKKWNEKSFDVRADCRNINHAHRAQKKKMKTRREREKTLDRNHSVHILWVGKLKKYALFSPRPTSFSKAREISY